MMKEKLLRDQEFQQLQQMSKNKWQNKGLRYRRSLPALSSEHLIRKKDKAVKPNEYDKAAEGTLEDEIIFEKDTQATADFNSNNNNNNNVEEHINNNEAEVLLNDLKDFNDDGDDVDGGEKRNVDKNDSDEAENENEDGNEAAAAKEYSFTKSNYRKVYDKEEQQQPDEQQQPPSAIALTSNKEESFTAKPSTDVVSTTTDSSSSSSSSSLSTLPIFVDKTLKINNLVSLNQSNKHKINKENYTELRKVFNLKENAVVKQIDEKKEELYKEQQQIKLLNEHFDEIETTTKLFTIFENYNYDEEENLLEDLNMDLLQNAKEFNQNVFKSKEIENFKPLKAHDDKRNIIKKNVKDKNQKEYPVTETVLVNHKSLEKNKSQNDDNNNDDNNENIKETADSNNFQINRFKKENIDSVAVNGHHLDDSNDDIYPSQEQEEVVVVTNIIKPPSSAVTVNANAPATATAPFMASDEEKEDAFENLMLNDGLLPLSPHHGYDDMNYVQNLDDIDIVKLEQTHSNEEELYKTINITKGQTKNTSKKYKSQLNTYNYDNDRQQNEVFVAQKDNNTPEMEAFEKPITSAPILRNSLTSAPKNSYTYNKENNNNNVSDKRILVNLTIASNDGSGNMYTLHVDIPAFDQQGQVQNVHQVLKHERHNNEQESFEEKVPQTESMKAFSAEAIKSSPYCIPEPPPPIPECPCLCEASSKSVLDLDLDTTDWLQMSDSSPSSSTATITTTTTPTIRPETSLTTAKTSFDTIPPNNILSNTGNTYHNDDVSNANAIDSDDIEAITTTTNNLFVDVIPDAYSNDNLNVKNSYENGEKFACPDVMPILILEGDLCIKNNFYAKISI